MDEGFCCSNCSRKNPDKIYRYEMGGVRLIMMYCNSCFDIGLHDAVKGMELISVDEFISSDIINE
jgi:hypothetical protein